VNVELDVLGVGCCSVDDLFYVPTYPTADAKMAATRSERQCGGLTATALVAAARLGAKCSFAGLLGHNDLSDAVQEALEAAGVDVSHAVRREGASPVHAVIIVAESGQTRNIFFDPTAPVGADPDEPNDELIRSAKVLFVDHLGVPGAIRAAKIAREAGRAVVADLEDDSHPRFPELLALVNHLFLTCDFALRITRAATPQQAVEALLDGSRSAVGVTVGAEGAWFAEPGGAVRHQSSFPVNVVDTTGCGDVFHGAYAAALARDLPLDERVRFACAAAALKATKHGGQAGAPTLAELEAFLKH
jgi:ribokinase